MVYEGASAAGLGLESRLPTPVPYVVPPEQPPAFQHSLRFDSAFEVRQLLLRLSCHRPWQGGGGGGPVRACPSSSSDHLTSQPASQTVG